MRATVAVCLLALLLGCAEPEPPPPPPPPPAEPPYPVSAAGGTPATGPGSRFNSCERIWCLVHRENFFVTHFQTGHRGWILHEEARGDVFSPSSGQDRVGFPEAKATAIRLCGDHFHPWMLGHGSGAIRHTGYNRTLGYGRGHFDRFGTRLDPCCLNGAGWGYLHAAAGRQFRFHDLAEYRAHPEKGWSKPFAARLPS